MYAVEQVIQSSSTSYKSVEVVKFSKLHVVHVRNFAKYLEQSKSSIKAKYYYWCFPDGSDDKECACNVGHLGSIPGSINSLEKGMATHCRILA